MYPARFISIVFHSRQLEQSKNQHLAQMVHGISSYPVDALLCAVNQNTRIMIENHANQKNGDYRTGTPKMERILAWNKNAFQATGQAKIDGKNGWEKCKKRYSN